MALRLGWTKQLVFLLCVAGLVIWSAVVKAGSKSEFITPPSTLWVPVPSAVNIPGQIYSPRNRGPAQFVVTHAFLLHNAEFSRSLVQHLDEIQEARGRFFELFGVSHYQILSHEVLQVQGIGATDVLHTQYVAPNGHIRHAIERQYVKGSRAFIVTYIKEVSSLSEQELRQINLILDQFRPAPRGRLNAKLTAVQELVEMFIERADATEAVNSDSVTKAENKIPDLGKLDISLGPVPEYCKEVPEGDRRTTNDLTAPDAIGPSDYADCPGALKRGAIDFLKMLDRIDRGTSTSTGDQIIAGVSVAATSFYNDPKGMTKRVLAGLYNFAKKKGKAGRNFFACVNARAAIRSLCKAVPGLVAGGVAGKIAAGGSAAVKAADEIGATLESTVARSGAKEAVDAAKTNLKGLDGDTLKSQSISTTELDSDRIASAQQAVGRDLTQEERQAVLHAHEIGNGEPGRNGSAAAVDNYTDAQLKAKAQTLKDAGFSQPERRALIENAVVGNPATDTATFAPKSLLQHTGDAKVDGFRDAYGAGNFSGAKKFISYYDASTGERYGAKVLRKLNDGRLEVEVPNADGSASKIALSPEDLTRVKLSDVSAANSLAAGQAVEIPRSNGGFSRGTVHDIQPNGQVTVHFEEKGVKLQKTLPASQLVTERPAALADKSPGLLASDMVQRFQDKIEEIAPRFDKSGRPQYSSNGYWRMWLGGDIHKLPQQGWKIHVGARPETAERIARLLTPELQKRDIAFKLVDDLKSFAARNPATDTQAGKFFTVYPKNSAEAGQIARMISDILKRDGFKPADFIDAPGEGRAGLGVSYRYGRITGGDLIDSRTGQRIPNSSDSLLNPHGQLVPDQRGLIAPAWATNPFH